VGILKVPHQGAATSDDGWLRDHAGHLAVISVGNNSFGHPSDRVIEILAESGAEVIRTDQEGDVVLDLAHDPSAK
jgi:competence protein ComEC